jgi:hypothetical protein
MSIILKKLTNYLVTIICHVLFYQINFMLVRFGLPDQDKYIFFLKINK